MFNGKLADVDNDGETQGLQEKRPECEPLHIKKEDEISNFDLLISVKARKKFVSSPIELHFCLNWFVDSSMDFIINIENN